MSSWPDFSEGDLGAERCCVTTITNVSRLVPLDLRDCQRQRYVIRLAKARRAPQSQRCCRTERKDEISMPPPSRDAELGYHCNNNNSLVPRLRRAELLEEGGAPSSATVCYRAGRSSFFFPLWLAAVSGGSAVGLNVPLSSKVPFRRPASHHLHHRPQLDHLDQKRARLAPVLQGSPVEHLIPLDRVQAGTQHILPTPSGAAPDVGAVWLSGSLPWVI